MRIYLFVLFLFSAKFSFAQEEYKLYGGDTGRKYEVKKITQYTYEKGDTTLTVNTIIRIFHNNKEDSVYSVDKKGVKHLYYINQYNAKWQLINLFYYSYDNNRKVSSHVAIIYDKNGKQTEVDRYEKLKDDTVILKWLYKYDSNGRLAEQDICNLDGTVASKLLCNYNNDQLVTQEVWNQVGATMKMTEKMEYKYDGFNDLIQTITYDYKGKILSDIEYKYADFDKNKNWTKMLTITHDYSPLPKIKDVVFSKYARRVIDY